MESLRSLSRRGTTNGNVRGNTEDRRRRREWLVKTYRADVDLFISPDTGFTMTWEKDSGNSYTYPACRCYRCGILLTVDTITVDRIIPGCQGGTYRRNNIRPACSRCNSETGAPLRRTE